MDMRLSLRITRRLRWISPAWFSASNAIPAAIAASPTTATVFRVLAKVLVSASNPESQGDCRPSVAGIKEVEDTLALVAKSRKCRRTFESRESDRAVQLRVCEDKFGG